MTKNSTKATKLVPVEFTLLRYDTFISYISFKLFQGSLITQTGNTFFLRQAAAERNFSPLVLLLRTVVQSGRGENYLVWKSSEETAVFLFIICIEKIATDYVNLHKYFNHTQNKIFIYLLQWYQTWLGIEK
jgi:hypothetical protein